MSDFADLLPMKMMHSPTPSTSYEPLHQIQFGDEQKAKKMVQQPVSSVDWLSVACSSIGSDESDEEMSLAVDASSGCSSPRPLGDEGEFRPSWIQVQEDGTCAFNCLWKECYSVISTMPELDAHLDDHLAHFNMSPIRVDGLYPCQVVTCRYAAETCQQMKAHLNMHVYHAELQEFGGRALAQRHEFRRVIDCRFSSELSVAYSGDPLFCLWAGCNQGHTDIKHHFDHVNKHVDLLTSDDRKDGKYVCLWEHCGKQEMHRANLRCHVRHHSGEKFCACPFCGQFFANTNKLCDHVSRRGRGHDENMTCQLCRKVFADERMLRVHAQGHVKHSRCPICRTTVNGDAALRRHMMHKHTNGKHPILACPHPTCTQTFHRKSDMDKHMVAMHSDGGRFACDECPERFKWRKQLAVHTRKAHSTGDAEAAARPYLCHMCDSRYSTGNGLSRHLLSSHGCAVPEGFSRYQYKRCADGCFRLQTSRIVSAQLAAQMAQADSRGTFNAYPIDITR